MANYSIEIVSTYSRITLDTIHNVLPDNIAANEWFGDFIKNSRYNNVCFVLAKGDWRIRQDINRVSRFAP